MKLTAALAFALGFAAGASREDAEEDFKGHAWDYKQNGAEWRITDPPCNTPN